MDMTMETCRKFVEVLASDAPAPGGGGAAALVGAIGTALGKLTATITGQLVAEIMQHDKCQRKHGNTTEKRHRGDVFRTKTFQKHSWYSSFLYSVVVFDQ